MDSDDFAEPRRSLHSGTQGCFVRSREIVDSTVGHESFESDHAALLQLLEFVEIAGNEPAPKRKVHQRIRLCGSQFLIKGRRINCGWMGIEGHIEEHGPASRGQSA